MLDGVQPAEVASFLLYLVALAVIAYAAWRHTRNVDDYALGGRRLSATVAALSAGASDMSGWLLLGLPGAIFVGGLTESWIVIGLVVGAYANWSIVAPRLRAMTRGASGARTIPEFFAHRFPDRGKTLATVATALILVFFGLYTAAGFVASAKLFNSTLGIDYQAALVAGAAIIMLYTALGGFLAVSWTDVMQGLLMMAALVVVPVLALADMASVDVGSHADMLQGMTVIGLASLVVWGLGYFGQPHILVRFMALSQAASVTRARTIGMSWMVLSCAGAIAVGLTGYAYASVAGAPADAETIFIHLARSLLSPWIAGFVIAAILAAVMSTIDSQLLVASTALSNDVIGAIRPDMGERQLIWVSRSAVIVVAAVGVWIASDPDRGVLELVAYAWAGLGATFGPAMLASLYWRRTSSAGIFAGMITGGATVMLWPMLGGRLGEIYELLPGFAFASLAIWLASASSAPTMAAQDAFDRLMAGPESGRP